MFVSVFAEVDRKDVEEEKQICIDIIFSLICDFPGANSVPK